MEIRPQSSLTTTSTATNNINRNNASDQTWTESFRRIALFVKRRLKLNRFLLVIETKKGVSISCITVIIVDLIDLLWHFSMTFGPLNSTMTSLLLLETFLVICVSSVLLYNIKSDNKADLKSMLFTWLAVVAIDYLLRSTMNISSLIVSEKASTTAKTMRSVATMVMFVLVFHCWQCVFTYYDDINGKITTVKITPSDERGRIQPNKRALLLGMKTSPMQDLNPNNLADHREANMLRAPTEELAKSRW